MLMSTAPPPRSLRPFGRPKAGRRCEDPAAHIRKRLGHLGQRRWHLHLLRDTGLFVAAATLMLLLLLLALGSQERAGLLRSLLLGLVGGGGVLFWVHLARLRRRLRNPHALARWVGERSPALRGDLLSTLELAEEAQRFPARFSPALYDALAQQTYRDLSSCSTLRLVPTAMLRPAAILLALTALVWTTAATVGSEQLGRAARGILAPQPAATATTQEPLIGDLRLTYRYPSYLRRAQRIVDSSTGQITAPRGTWLKLEANALGPYRRLELVLERQGQPPRRLRLQARGQVWSTELRIDGEGHYRFHATLLSGRRLQDPVRRRIDIEVDAHPTVTLFGPADGLEVAAQQRIELGYVARDDHGLSTLSLAYSVNGAPPQLLSLWKSTLPKDSRRQAGRYDWDLGPLNLARGGRVAYWLEARDDDTVSGPKVARSRVLHLQVFSREERHDRTLAAQRQLLEQALRQLAQRLVLFPATTKLLPPSTPRILQLRWAATRLSSLVDGLRSLEARMRRDEEVSRSVLGAIGRLHQRLRGLQRKEHQFQTRTRGKRSSETLAGALLAAAQGLNGQVVVALEDGSLLLANLLDEQRLQQITEASRRLTDTRKQLSTLLARYAKSRDPALRKQIEAQIRELQRQLATLLQKLAKLSKTLPDEYLNHEAVQRLGLARQAEDLAKLFASGKIDKLQAALAALDKKLADMRKLLDGNLQSFRDQRMSARERAFGKMMDRLHELESEQQAIKRSTEGVVQKYRKRAGQALDKKLAPLLDAQLRRLAKLRKELSKVDRRTIASYQREQLERSDRLEKWLRAALKQRDLAQSLEMAKRLHAALDLLHDDLRGGAIDRYLWRRPTRQAVKRVKGAQSIAAEIQHDLEKQLPKPGSLLGRKELETLRKLQRRQQALKRRVSDLRRKLGGKQPPPQGLPDGLRRTEQMMEGAKQKLGQVRPAQAQSAQEGAAKQLRALRESLRRSRQPRSSARGDTNRKRVPIPGAESFKPPREFRQDLLDAMKEAPPPSYEGQVRRYYRELVR